MVLYFGYWSDWSITSRCYWSSIHVAFLYINPPYIRKGNHSKPPRQVSSISRYVYSLLSIFFSYINCSLLNISYEQRSLFAETAKSNDNDFAPRKWFLTLFSLKFWTEYWKIIQRLKPFYRGNFWKVFLQLKIFTVQLWISDSLSITVSPTSLHFLKQLKLRCSLNYANFTE